MPTKAKSFLRCWAKGCPNNKNITPDLPFYTFPKDEERSRQWLDIVGCKHDSSSNIHSTRKRVCGIHFAEKDRGKYRLRSTAIPSLFLADKYPPQGPDEAITDSIPQDHDYCAEIDTPKQSRTLEPDQSNVLINDDQPANTNDHNNAATGTYRPEDKSKTFQPNQSNVPMNYDHPANNNDQNDTTTITTGTCRPKEQSNRTEEPDQSNAPMNYDQSANYTTDYDNAKTIIDAKEHTSPLMACGQPTIQTYNTTSNAYRYRTENAKLKMEVRRLKKNMKQQRKRYKCKQKMQQNRIKALSKELDQLAKKGTTSVEELKDHPVLQNLVQSQIRLNKNRPKGRRYTEKDKVNAISLYYQSPESYMHQSKILHLPSKRTINRWLEGMKFETGFDNDILKILSKRVENMSEMEKVCVLLIDEVSLKEGLKYNERKDVIEGLEDFGSLGRTKRVANQGLVFMVRGLQTNWKQPLAYFFSRDSTPDITLSTLISDCIHKLYDIGLYVKVCIGDQGVGNRGAFTNLGVTEDKPYIYICGQKIYFMYDPPHLLKSIINTLHKHNINIGGNIVKWEYISEYYKLESKKGNTGLRASHKLTEKHIQLPPFSKMSVPIAAQILSRSVAHGINTYVACKELHGEAAYTADFCYQMDELFDSVNGQSCVNKECKTKPMKSAVDEESQHVSYWQKKIQWLRSWEFDSSPVQCVNGWIMTLKALILLWQDLKANYCFTFLLPSRCNRDCLENLFSVLRQKGGSNDNPQCNQFRNCLKAAVVDRFLQPVGRNCRFLSDDDNDTEFVDQLLQCTKANTQSTSRYQTETYNAVPSQLSEDNVYICGYLYKGLCKKLRKVCDNCKSAMINNDQLDHDQELLLCHFRAAEVEGRDFGLLQVATPAFIELISQFDNIFKAQFHVGHHSYQLGEAIKRQMNLQTFQQQQLLQICPAAMEQIISLFVRMRIHHAIKHFNKSLRTTKRKNRKYLKIAHL